jgi:hypothetical protein
MLAGHVGANAVRGELDRAVGDGRGVGVSGDDPPLCANPSRQQVTAAVTAALVEVGLVVPDDPWLPAHTSMKQLADVLTDTLTKIDVVLAGFKRGRGRAKDWPCEEFVSMVVFVLALAGEPLKRGKNGNLARILRIVLAAAGEPKFKDLSRMVGRSAQLITDLYTHAGGEEGSGKESLGAFAGLLSIYLGWEAVASD